MIIAIDGPAGAGKSEVSKRVAQVLGYKYIDTGAMYRAVAWKVLKNKANIEDEDELHKLIKDTKINFKSERNIFRIFVDGKEITGEIRTQAVTEKSNTISRIRKIREYLLDLQRKAGIEGGVVMEGRDIGTVVFPQAERKFYLDATLKVRAKRRYEELRRQGQKVELKEIEESIRIRDEKDKSRDLNPLCIASDAIVVDTSNLTIEGVVSFIVSKILKAKR